MLFKNPEYLLDFRNFARPLILMYCSIFPWGESDDTFKYCAVSPSKYFVYLVT